MTISLVTQLSIQPESTLGQLRRTLAERDVSAHPNYQPDPLVLMWITERTSISGDDYYAFAGFICPESRPCRGRGKRFFAHAWAAVCGTNLMGEKTSVLLDDTRQGGDMSAGLETPFLEQVDKIESLPIAAGFAHGGPHVAFARRLRPLLRKNPEEAKVIDLIGDPQGDGGTFSLASPYTAHLSVVPESVACDTIRRVHRSASKEVRSSVSSSRRRNAERWITFPEAAWQVATDKHLKESLRAEARRLHESLLTTPRRENSIWRFSDNHEALEESEGTRIERAQLAAQALVGLGVEAELATAVGERVAVGA